MKDKLVNLARQIIKGYNVAPAEDVGTDGYRLATLLLQHWGLPITPPDIEEFEPTGTRCSDCGEIQYATPSGPCCVNGHGGAPPMEDM